LRIKQNGYISKKSNMIQGAMIGVIVGVVFYFIQKSKEKKANDQLDDDLLNREEK